MSADTPTSPPFYCPACGKKHRADLSALGDGSRALARVACARCEVVMSIFLGSDGLPKCEARAQPEKKNEPAPQVQLAGSAPSSPSSDTAAPGVGSADGVPMSQSATPHTKSSLPLQLAAAALVGAVVSFFVASAAQPGASEQTPAADARLTHVLEQVGALETRLARSEQALAEERNSRVRTEQELRTAIASNATGLNAQGETVTRMEQLQIASSAAAKKIEDAYQGLHGRIESNYTQTSALKRRVDKLATK